MSAGRPRIREAKVKLHPLADELVRLLLRLPTSERKALFEDLGLSYSSFSQWRTGQSHPTLMPMTKLFRAFDRELTSARLSK